MILDILYAVFIQPIEWGMGWIFAKAYGLLGSYGLAIIVLSLVVNLALIPIYYISDRWLEEERSIQDKMKPKLEEIKTVFEGQERFMMTRMLYRIHSYHPLLAVRNSVGLLIQIPFFFAAYQLLSNYEALNGVSFFIFNDLSRPDGLLSIGSWHINIMPFVMTAINLASAYIFAKGLSVKDQAQSYIIAAIFLVLLYTMPVGLVLYWTVNNIFSLIKNLLYKGSSLFKALVTSKPVKYFNKLAFELSVVVFGYFLLTQVAVRYLPSGVTQDFISRSNRLFLPLAILALVFCCITVFAKKEVVYSKQREPVSYLDFTLVLIAYLPLAQYFIVNANDILLPELAQALVFSFILLVIVIVYIPYQLSLIVNKRLLQVVILSVLALVFYMPMVSSYFSFYNKGSLKVLLPYAFLVIVLSYIVAKFNSRVLFIFSAIALLTNSMNQIINLNKIESSDSAEMSTSNREFIQESFNKKYNIYLLTYDGYVVNETMMQYSIDNSEQETFLKDKGFALYPKTYTVGANSVNTMGRVLDITDGNKGLKDSAAGHGYALDTLRSNDYLTGGYFRNDYFFRGNKEGPKYDFLYPQINTSNSQESSSLPYILQSIGEGQFRFDVGFEYSDSSHEDFIAAKRNFFSQKNNKPKFIYTHTGPDHSQNSGQCLPDETQQFKERLDLANKEMKGDVEAILENDKNAIIIVHGDHGPYLTKNCTGLTNYQSSEVSRLDLQDRFGSFLAIRLPNGDVIKEDKITVLQDLFPEIFNYLSNSNKFDQLKIQPVTLDRPASAGVYIDNGIIHGGINDGEPLYIQSQ